MTKRLMDAIDEVKKRLHSEWGQCELRHQGIPFEEYVDALVEQALIDRGMAEEQPRPCPFCGEKMYIEENFLTSADTTVFYPRCSSYECIANQGWVSFPTEQEAIEAWNRRV